MSIQQNYTQKTSDLSEHVGILKDSILTQYLHVDMYIELL